MEHVSFSTTLLLHTAITLNAVNVELELRALSYVEQHPVHLSHNSTMLHANSVIYHLLQRRKWFDLHFYSVY